MTRCLPVLLLCTLTFAAEPFSNEISACVQRLQGLSNNAQATEREASLLRPLPVVPFDPEMPLPPIRPNETIATAEGGLYFDNNASSLTYFGNARLNDSRLQLRAANRLFLLLPPDGKQKVEQEALGKDEKAPPKVTTPAKPHAGNAPPVKVEQPKQPEKKKSKPISIVTRNAAVDFRTGRAVLEGRRMGDPSLIISGEGGRALLYRRAAHEGAELYADELGNVVMKCKRLEAEWKDENGATWHLVSTGDFVLFRAEARELFFHGNVQVTTPHGNLSCKNSLSVFFTAAPDAPPGNHPPVSREKQPFSQFTNMRVKDVDHIVADGESLLSLPEQQGRPASRVSGEVLVYHVATGVCRVSGGKPSICFGENTLNTNGVIHLFENGNIEVTGSDISGIYKRPVPGEKEGKIFSGVYKTRGTVSYDAATRVVLLPSGLDARDEGAFFHCTGECRAVLLPPEGTPPPRAKGAPNLAIAQTGGIGTVHAQGDVTMHSDAAAASPVCDVRADMAQVDLQHGTAVFRSEKGHPIDARYGEYSLAARSQGAHQSHLHVLQNGDIVANGDRVALSLPGEKGTSHASCAEELRLQREAGVLLMGREASIETPDGILTSRGELRAVLIAGSAENARKAPAHYPHLSYNFTGVRTAETHEGGTLRTAQTSMQCEGDIEVEINPDATGKADRSSVRSALATKKVRVVNKDAAGRLMRADGDRLRLDPATGNIYLTGDTVYLQNEYTVHTVSGAGACVTIDPKNNVHLSGARQTTNSVHIHEQIKKNEKR